MDYFKTALTFLGIESGWNDFSPLCGCIYDTKSVSSCFERHDALASVILLMLIFALYSFVWSVVGKNCSKVDQIWSITPFVYCWMIYYHDQLKRAETGTSRLYVLTVLVTLWGLRLTYNFWRRGGYGNFFTHEEDYRWEYVRKNLVPNPYLFVIFNITFIAFFQNALLMLIAVPAYWVGKTGKRFDWSNPLDVGLSLMFIALLIMETVADEQQWRFQNMKHAIPSNERSSHSEKDVRQGFLTSGLFKHCRHPNYFAEQAIWVVVYLFSVNFDSLTSVNCLCFTSYRSMGGVVLLILLFKSSIDFSEGITTSKYPDYVRYQSTTRKCFPSVLSMITTTNFHVFGMKEATTMSIFVLGTSIFFMYWLGTFERLGAAIMNLLVVSWNLLVDIAN